MNHYLLEKGQTVWINGIPVELQAEVHVDSGTALEEVDGVNLVGAESDD